MTVKNPKEDINMENTVVKIQDLVKRYGDLIALDHFTCKDFEICRPE